MLLASSGVSGSTSKTYAETIIGVQLRTGNGTSQSVTTGFKPDLIWTKSRSAATGHRLVDSARGAGNSLESNSTLAQQSEATGITAFNSSGYSVGADSDYNTNAATYVDFVFRKAPKFFDVVTWTGDGVAGRQIPHSLGATPGMIIVKRTDTSSSFGWVVYHRSRGATEFGLLNATNKFDPITTFWNSTEPTSSVFTVGTNADVNSNGGTFVAYLFAHDPSAEGVIQCGSFTTDGSGNATVNLGWEPQFVLLKQTSAIGSWFMLDSMRGIPIGSGDARLLADSSAAEANGTILDVNAVGFSQSGWTANVTQIYLAIRRPNKPPKTGTEVFSPVTQNNPTGGTTLTVTGTFPVDLNLIMLRQGSQGPFTAARLAGNKYLTTSSAASEGSGTPLFNGDGKQNSVQWLSVTNGDYINWLFRRAPGFFSSFAYTGTGVNRTTPHDLAAIPDLLIVKSRSAATDWQVWCNGLAANEKLVLNSNAGKVTDATAWNSTLPTSTNISLGTTSATNANGATFIAYAFSNLPGIQKIGTYVGNGTSGRVIDCGFSGGARFVCIKAISTAGSWLVSDSARGIVSGNDPYLQLNSTAAEVTTEDWLDPSSVGFIVNNVSSSNANASGVTYMYWAIA